MTRILSPAKLNLFLYVTGKRDDGYHTLCSLMTCIDLYDELDLTVGGGKGIRVRCDNPGVPEDASNLVHRAAVLFRERLRSLNPGMDPFPGLNIVIHKTIPVGAGLGGGSSNAACVLKALNRINGNPFSRNELMSMGLTLGADVPFFIHGGPALARGIGEELTECGPLRPYHVLVVYPGIAASTALVYKNVDLGLTNIGKSNNNPLLNLCGEGRELDVKGLLHNDLETAACRLYPEIESVKRKMTGILSDGVLMTGSGSSFFVLFSEQDQAELAFMALQGWEMAGKQLFLTSFAAVCKQGQCEK
ncbi:MAG: 4-(cytidine 5'-diphospho)-2-C-methyl-D-erythritol kinase [Pseudomonadota bacterium]